MTIPEILHKASGGIISNILLSVGEQTLNVFTKRDGIIDEDTISSVYTQSIKKVKTIDFYYDGDIERSVKSPLALRSGIGTKSFPILRSDTMIDEEVRDFLECVDRELRNHCPDTFIRIFCQGTIGVFRLSRLIICPWKDDTHHGKIFFDTPTAVGSSSVVGTVYFIDTDITVLRATANTFDGTICFDNCKLGLSKTHILDETVYMRGVSFFNSNVDLVTEENTYIHGGYCIDSVIKIFHDIYSAYALDFIYIGKSSISVVTNKKNNKSSADIRSDYIWDTDFSVPDGTIFTRGSMIVKSNFVIGRGEYLDAYICNADFIKDCNANVTLLDGEDDLYNDVAVFVSGFHDYTLGTCINCSCVITIKMEEGRFEYENIVGYRCDLAKNCQCQINIDLGLKSAQDARLNLVGFYVSHEGDLADCNVDFQGTFHAKALSIYNDQVKYNANIRFICAGIKAYSEEEASELVNDISMTKDVTFTHDTPGQSSKDIWNICSFSEIYAEACVNTLYGEYINAECTHYIYSNNENKPFPEIKHDCNL